MKSAYDVITNIMMTEKSALLKEQNQYAFKVSMDSTKLEVAAAIEKIYGVKDDGRIVAVLARQGEKVVKGQIVAFIQPD